MYISEICESSRPWAWSPIARRSGAVAPAARADRWRSEISGPNPRDPPRPAGLVIEDHLRSLEYVLKNLH